MADALVETKLLLPRPRRGAVPRPRLAGLLAHGRGAPLVLLSAPAGFGKTTLLGDWVTAERSGPDRLAWVSLDERDRHGTSFWAYLLLAVERVAPGTAAAASTLLQSGQAPIETVLTSLVNELSVQSEDVTVVLDDYHLADGPAVAEGMTFLLDHLPPQLHLIVSSRADPALPLSRLRARGDLVELRAADLRFTEAEVAVYLQDLDLPAAAVTALETRTEGWIAALQLAVLSLRDRADAAGFVDRFAGDDRFVVDYLVDEVLDRQPEDVRRFLLDTAVLDELTAPLCDAVRAAPDARSSRAMLDLLDRQNLFLVQLDGRRERYRYHHLFGDMLRAHLLQERPADVPGLHGRASRWYADTGRPEPAVRHALAAGDVALAAEIAERSIPDLRRHRRESVIRGWVDELPRDAVRDRPVLAIGLVGGLMASNDFRGVDGRLREVEELLRRPASELVVVEQDELDAVPARIEMYRAALALLAGDPAGTVTRAQRATEAAPPGDELTRAAACALAGLAQWSTGDVAAAHASYASAAAGLERAGYVPDVLGCSLTLADLELTLGRLGDARGTLERAVALADRHAAGAGPATDVGVMRGTADMLVALSRAAWHRNELTRAADLLRRADELGSAELPQNPYRWRVALARLRAAERDWPTTLELLDEAERVYVADYSPPVHPVHASRARVLAACGDLDGATAWARRHGVGASDDLSYLREYEHVTLARVLLARHRAAGAPEALTTAVALLDRLLAAAEAGGRLGTVIEVETLRAVARDTAGDGQAAASALDHAVELAEPEGWVRFFVDAGPGMAGLLRALARRRTTSAFVGELLAAVSPSGPPAASGPPVRPVGSLVDPLSDRELEVLRLLGSDLDGPGIARELVVSLNTVRTHTKHIYAKLGVNNRRSALSRAHQLGLLARSPADHRTDHHIV